MQLCLIQYAIGGIGKQAQGIKTPPHETTEFPRWFLSFKELNPSDVFPEAQFGTGAVGVFPPVGRGTRVETPEETGKIIFVGKSKTLRDFLDRKIRGGQKIFCPHGKLRVEHIPQRHPEIRPEHPAELVVGTVLDGGDFLHGCLGGGFVPDVVNEPCVFDQPSAEIHIGETRRHLPEQLYENLLTQGFKLKEVLPCRRSRVSAGKQLKKAG